MIKGQLKKGETNKFGFFRINVAGEWYGADKKGTPSGIAEGDIVEFEPYTNDKGYASFKFQSLKKVAGASEAAPAVAGAGNSRSGGTKTNRDSYWTDKAVVDAAKEPKIAYFAASERAIQFVALAFTTGALASLTKAKDTAKLDVLTALVDEQTQRILVASYAQQAPLATMEAPASAEASTETSGEGDAEWK